MAAIEVSGLVVRYGALTAVDEVTIKVEAGTVLALLGPNGAGKTTVVETLEGYRRPHAGSVRVLGLDPVADHRRLMPQIGVMLQRGGVYPAMSARAALRLFAQYYVDPEPPDGLLDRVGLAAAADTPWRRLSGGEQQRASLALALVGRPRLAFLDEPTAGMDPQARQLTWQLIRDLRAGGVTVVLTTHYLEEAERLADRVVILDRGRVVVSGTPAELMFANQGRQIRFGAPAGLDVASLAIAVDGPVSEASPGEYTVGAEATPARVAALTAWLAQRELPLADLRAGRETLEDVFLRITSATSAAETDRQPRSRRSRPAGRR